MHGFVLVLTLAVVGGAIAYIGDQLGMNVGRKKLTLFGLRPKHTSVLVTIVTGVAIATASIGILTIASQDVRIALFKMKEIQTELAGLQTDYEKAQQEVQRQRKAIAENEDNIASLEAEAFALQGDIDELQGDFDELVGYYFQISTAFGQIREANIAFHASEVISSTVVKEGLSRAKVRSSLEEFIQEVDEVAYRRSARAQESGPYRAIDLHPAALDFAVEDVLLSKGDVVVRAVSESNTIPGVPVVVYLENYTDEMVFSKDTVLARSSWDPRGGVEIDRVILQILAQANSMVLDAGMALSEDRGAAVLLPGDAFFEVIFASRNLKDPVEIQLVVAEDTCRSHTPVQVYLKIVE